MRRSKAAAILLVASLTIVGVGGPGTAADSGPAVDSAPTAATNPDPSTAASAVLEDAEAALEGESVETPQDSPVPAEEAAPVESPSVALAELVAVYPQLSEREQLEADALLARPDGTGDPSIDIKTWNAAARNSAITDCGPHVCVHYATTTESNDSATSEWAAKNVKILEDVWTYEVSTLGYRAPASDGEVGNASGDYTTRKFDVYLAEIGNRGYYGYCAPEGYVSDEPGRAFAYCVLDNNFTDFLGTPEDNLKVTAAHEFFHAIQYNYDFAEDKWLMEATATWMEERYADSVNDNRQYLEYGQMGRPNTPMDTFGGLTHYGNWPFFERLTRKYGVIAVRSIWNRLDANTGAPDQYSIQAVKNYLKSQGTSLPKFYAHYAAGNLAPSRAYPEGSAYKATKFADTFKLKKSRTTIAPHKAKLKHLTSKSYRFKPAASLPGKAKLRIRIDGPGKKTSPAAVAYVYFKSGKLTKKFIKLNKSGAGSTRAKFAPGKIKRVNLTLVNASTRYSCWTGGAYSCEGSAKDNASKFIFSAKVIR